MYTYLCMLLYNNGGFKTNFTKLFLYHVISSFFYHLFFAIFTLFNLSSSSIIVFLVQFFIFSNHWLLKIFIWFPFKFSPSYLHKFYRFTFLNLPSTSTLPLPTWFSYKFIFTSFPPLSPLFLPSCSQQKDQYSLSLSLQFCLFWWFFFYHFFPANSSFCYCWLIVTSHMFLFLTNLYRLLCIFSYFGIPIPNHNFFLSHCVDLI